jgi:hypothetical protein
VHVTSLRARALAVRYRTPAKANFAAIKESNIRARPEKKRQQSTFYYRGTGHRNMRFGIKWLFFE